MSDASPAWRGRYRQAARDAVFLTEPVADPPAGLPGRRAPHRPGRRHCRPRRRRPRAGPGPVRLVALRRDRAPGRGRRRLQRVRPGSLPAPRGRRAGRAHPARAPARPPAVGGPDLGRRRPRRAPRDLGARPRLDHRGPRRAEADARSRLERDIHDGPQQRLVRLGMDLARAKRQTSRDPRAAETILDGAIAQIREALDELRGLSRGIAPPVLVDRGLAAALAEVAVRSGVPGAVVEDGALRLWVVDDGVGGASVDDVIIADIRMPPSHTDEGLRAATRIRRQWASAPILLLSQYVVAGYLPELLADGGAGSDTSSRTASPTSTPSCPPWSAWRAASWSWIPTSWPRSCGAGGATTPLRPSRPASRTPRTASCEQGPTVRVGAPGRRLAILPRRPATAASRSAKRGGLPERPMGADCKSAAECYGGSNPSPATMVTGSSDRVVRNVPPGEHPAVSEDTGVGVAAAIPVRLEFRSLPR